MPPNDLTHDPNLLNRSLTPAWVRWMDWPAIIAVVLVLVAAGLMPIVAILVGGVLGKILFWFVVVDRFVVPAERRWLQSLPWAFDAQAYLALLDSPRYRTTLELTVKLAAPPSGSARKEILAALAGALPGLRTKWDDDDLVIVSPDLSTATTWKGGYYTPHNGPANDWFRRVVRRGLPLVDGRARIARLEARLRS